MKCKRWNVKDENNHISLSYHYNYYQEYVRSVLITWSDIKLMKIRKYDNFDYAKLSSLQVHVFLMQEIDFSFTSLLMGEETDSVIDVFDHMRLAERNKIRLMCLTQGELKWNVLHAPLHFSAFSCARNREDVQCAPSIIQSQTSSKSYPRNFSP